MTPVRALLAGVAAVALAVGCDSVASPLVTIGTGIAVPADTLREVDRCMAEAGFEATAVHQGRSGSNEHYSWRTTTWYEWKPVGPNANQIAMANCRARFAPYVEKTESELREIYDRWVLERECLMRLGLQPAPPPTFEEFRASWRTGPWMPVDRVEHLIGADAKARCGLEMLE